jgi:hypothetical protein
VYMRVQGTMVHKPDRASLPLAWQIGLGPHVAGGGRGGRDGAPKTRLAASQFAAKSKMARRFVTLGRPRGGRTVRGTPRGGRGRPTGVRGAAPATVTEGAGPATGRDGAPKTRLAASQFAAKSKMARGFVTFGPPRGCPTGPGGRRGGRGRPTGVRGAAPATVTEGAGPATGRDGAPKTRLAASEFGMKWCINGMK